MITEPLYYKKVMIVHPQSLIIWCLDWFPPDTDNELSRLAGGYVFIEPVISMDGSDLYRVYPNSIFRNADHMVIFWFAETNTFEIDFSCSDFGHKLGEKDSLRYMNINFPDAMVATQVYRERMKRIAQIIATMRNN